MTRNLYYLLDINVKLLHTSARYQPKGIFLVAGLLATQMEKRDIINDAKSVNKCAASVAIAKLFDNTPPIEKRREICRNTRATSIFLYTDMWLVWKINEKSDIKKNIKLPMISAIIKITQSALAINNFFRAFLSISSFLSLWQWSSRDAENVTFVTLHHSQLYLFKN